MKRYLALFLISVLCLFLQARSETRIFLFDCSGSMFGYGYEMATYGNIFYTARDSMASHIKDLPDSVKVIVVPFCKHLGNPITGSNSDIAQKVLNLKYGGTDSDISQVWEDAQALKTSDKTIYFLVTDGFDNWGGVDDLNKFAESYSANAHHDEITYFYLAKEPMKNSALAQKFLELPHLDITDHFDVNPFFRQGQPDTEQGLVPQQIQEDEQKDEQKDGQKDGQESKAESENALNWHNYARCLFWLLIILAFCAGVYSLYKFKKKMDIGKVVPSGNGGINCEERSISEIVQNKFPLICVQTAEKICEKNNVQLHRLYKFIKVANSYGKVPQPSKNLTVDFSPCAYPLGEAMTKEELASVLKERNMEVNAGNIRELHYQQAREQFAQVLKTTPKVAGEIIGALDLAIHETEDGKYQLVPNNLHRFQQLYKHKGLVSKRIKELTGEDYDDSNDDSNDD